MLFRAVLVSLFGLLAAKAVPPTNYYNTAVGKTGQELRLALHTIIRNHRVIPYSSSGFDTSDALKVLDEDPANTNNVWLLYAQRSEPKSTFGLTNGWNREHMWPNSYGLDDSAPEDRDLHNLRAEDWNVNSSRGNKFYDQSDPADRYYTNRAHIEAPLCTTDSDSWEPPANVKGDIARSAFYMDVRYGGTSTNEPDLILTDRLNLISATNAYMGRLTTLILWHLADPVDDAERRRNDLIYDLYQYNRNPFVDTPEFVEAVFLPRLKIARVPGSGAVRVTWPRDYSARLETSLGLHLPWFTTSLTGSEQPNGEWGESFMVPAFPTFVRLLLE